MNYYSFQIFCDVDEAPVPEYGQFFEYGPAAFNLALKDDELSKFEALLNSYGIRILVRHNLSSPIDEVSHDGEGFFDGSTVLGQDETTHFALPSAEQSAGTTRGDIFGPSIHIEGDEEGTRKVN